MKRFFATVYDLLKKSLSILLDNDPLRMAGATSFFTTFALPPIIIIILRIFGIFLNRHNLGRQILEKLSSLIGKESADQVITTIRSFRALQHNWLITAVSFLFLLFVATTLFRIIRSSLNQIWDIRVVANRTIKQKFSSRLNAIVIILFTGLLFLGVLLIDGVQSVVGEYFIKIAPVTTHYINAVFSQLISVAVVTLWFFVLFIYLPDGRPDRLVALVGALLTGVLFTIGKLLVRSLLSQSSLGSLYGTSGAMVFLLLFVFYSSLILYFGAAFTKVWSLRHNKPIQPRDYAARYHIRLINVPESEDAPKS
jgi:membrane protein